MDTLVLIKSVLVALWFLAFLAGERLRPAATPPPGEVPEGRYGWRRLSRNLGLWGLNTALSPLLVLPISLWAATAALDWRDALIPGAEAHWTGLIFDLLLLDAYIYWWHRLNHSVPLLWRFHEVHHLDSRLDASSALRFHFGEVLLSALARASLVLLFGIDLLSIILFETLVLLGAIFHHSNLRLPAGLERALSLVVVTPSIHWVHHHRIREDTDSNYATLLSVWDKLFGSRSRHARRPDMAIGTEGRAEQPLTGLLIAPFARR